MKHIFFLTQVDKRGGVSLAVESPLQSEYDMVDLATGDGRRPQGHANHRNKGILYSLIISDINDQICFSVHTV